MGAPVKNGGSQGEQRLLTLKEAAEILRLPHRVVRQYARRGELTGQLIGGRWRFTRKDIDAFFDATPQWQFRQDSEHFTFARPAN